MSVIVPMAPDDCINPVTAMTPYADVEVPDDAMLDRMLQQTKGRLFFQKGAGFLGSLLCDHNFVWDDTEPTAWCNGSTIGWNRQFFYWLTPDERVTVLAHELWHTGFDHISRFAALGPNECPDIYNKAADFVINWMLKKFGFVFGDKLMSISPCLDPQYDEMFTEQVYHLLPKPPKKPNQGGGNCPEGDQPSKSDNTPGLSGDLKAPPKGQDRQKQIGKLVKARQAAIQAKEAGDLPGEITQIIDSFLNPILPWEVLLSRFFTELSKDDFSWRRPNRRYDDEYLPSLMGENGLEHLIYYIDISGSITDGTVLRFNSEVKHIHKEFRPKRLTLVTFDEIIQDVYEFTEDDGFDAIEITGRGGTSLAPVQAHIKKHRPTAAVIFSDLHVTPMHTNPGVPILWVVVGNPNAQTRFGKKIHIEEE